MVGLEGFIPLLYGISVCYLIRYRPPAAVIAARSSRAAAYWLLTLEQGKRCCCVCALHAINPLII